MPLSRRQKIMFFGTADFAVPILEALIKNGWPIKLVVTQPDQPAGRHQILQPPPVKILAEKLGLKVLQPLRLNSKFDPPAGGRNSKLFIVCAYGQFLPPELLKIPRYGAINIHPSLLPKYRGPSPIQTAILNGDQETGVSLILLDEEMDHGPILTQKATPIGPNETYPELAARLAQLSAEVLMEVLPKWLQDQIEPKPQDHSQATFTKSLTREDGRIDWSRPAREIYNQWRALQPWPGVFTELRTANYELRIKLIKINPSLKKTGEIKGSFSSPFIKLDKTGLGMVCGDGKILAIDQLQPEGKKVMTAEEFINGYMT